MKKMCWGLQTQIKDAQIASNEITKGEVAVPRAAEASLLKARG